MRAMLADGCILNVSADENHELFWATLSVRRSFGIVKPMEGRTCDMIEGDSKYGAGKRSLCCDE